jgi:nitroimidazol reductase NimA-like FMN-containing flavoprotein (pyridoxamine 5'-phosphate oxidase superfamily)
VSTTTRLDDAARDAFLGTGGTGVLAFAAGADDPPHALPVSYGYDADETAFYFRLAVGGDGAKADLLDRPVAFVVYGERDDRWHSVVARGRLAATEDDPDALAGLDRVTVPLFDVFGRPPREVPFVFRRLDPDDLTARRESTARP